VRPPSSHMNVGKASSPCVRSFSPSDWYFHAAPDQRRQALNTTPFLASFSFMCLCSAAQQYLEDPVLNFLPNGEANPYRKLHRLAAKRLMYVPSSYALTAAVREAQRNATVGLGPVSSVRVVHISHFPFFSLWYVSQRREWSEHPQRLVLEPRRREPPSPPPPARDPRPPVLQVDACTWRVWQRRADSAEQLGNAFPRPVPVPPPREQRLRRPWVGATRRASGGGGPHGPRTHGR
jgi:hypothetical protein